MSEAVIPHSFSEAAAALAGAAAQERPVRVVGGGTKLGWGGIGPTRPLRLLTTHLNRLVVHEGQTTATINAGTPLLRAQSMLAHSGLMLPVDPHLGLGPNRSATIGGVVATADSGPLSHRYGPVRDQIAGVTAALPDGTLARTGLRSDDRQDGYDLARLLVGSFGTLGVILAVEVRLRPLPSASATAIGASADPACLRETALAIADEHRDLEAFDVAWRDGRGGLLAQVAGDEAGARAAIVADTMNRCGLEGATVQTADASLWARQRAGQRSAERAVLRVHMRCGDLDMVLRLADAAGATVVGRAALGLLYMTLDVNRIATVRAGLPEGTGAVVLDLPSTARGAVDPWGPVDRAHLDLMRAVKGRFDPAGVCNPGIFVGRI